MSPRRTRHQYYSNPMNFYYSSTVYSPYSSVWSQQWMKLLPAWIKTDVSKKRTLPYYGQSFGNASCEVSAGCLTIYDSQFTVIIQSALVSDEMWEEVAMKLSKRALWEAYLTDDYHNYSRIPSFGKVAETLVPSSFSSLKIHCSCQKELSKMKIHCSHIRQAWNAFATQADLNPWLLFQFRGRSQKEFLGMIHQHRAQEVTKKQKRVQPTEERMPDTQSEDKGGRWDLAFWQGEIPFPSPISRSMQTGMNRGSENPNNSEKDPVVINGCDLRGLIPKIDPQISPKVEKDLKRTSQEITSFPPVGITKIDAAKALINHLIDGAKKYRIPSSKNIAPRQNILEKISFNEKKPQKRKIKPITKSESEFINEPVKKVTIQTNYSQNQKYVKNEKVQHLNPRNYVEGKVRAYYIRIYQSPPRVIEVNPLSSVKELGRVLLRGCKLPIKSAFEFYDSTCEIATSTFIPTEDEQALPKNAVPILDIHQRKVKDMLPREGDFVFFRPNVESLMLNRVELYRIGLRLNVSEEMKTFGEDTCGGLKGSPKNFDIANETTDSEGIVTISKILEEFCVERGKILDPGIPLDEVKSVLTEYQEYLDLYGPSYLWEGQGIVNPWGFVLRPSTTSGKKFCKMQNSHFLGIIGFGEFYNSYLFTNLEVERKNFLQRIAILRILATWLRERGILTKFDHEEMQNDCDLVENMIPEETQN